MVAEISKSEDVYQLAFRSLGNTSSPITWVKLLRDSAMDRFESVGFPTVSDEEWKYTNLAPLTRAGFNPVVSRADLQLDRFANFGYAETRDSHVLVVDGFLRDELTSPSGLAQIVVIDLLTAIADEKYGKLISDHLARNAHYHDNSLTALNTAFLQSGVFVLIPKNVKLEAPLQITYVGDQEDGARFPRTLVVAEENSSAVIVENFVSADEGDKGFTNSVTEIVLREGARLQHYRIQREALHTLHVSTTAVELGRGSTYNTTSVNLGARLSRHDVSVVMDNEGAECWVDGLYLVGQNQHTDTHSVIDHKQPYCNSHQLYKGILDGNARAVFNGKVFVREGAQKTDAMQTNKNLLLSTQARVDTKPQLEIYADDVKCAHGAAVGQLDEDELFYLQARGINPELGRSLLTYGFAEELIGKIELESIRAQLDEIVLNRLHTDVVL
jgi:Fe-S cluster assembly protein SufD